MIQPFGGTGSWSVVRSRFAGITPVTPKLSPRKPPQSRLSHLHPPKQAFPLLQRERGEKISEGKGIRPQVSWPIALRAVRGWLEPWIMLRRFWRAWSEQPPPPLLQCLLDQLERGQGLFLYGTF